MRDGGAGSYGTLGNENSVSSRLLDRPVSSNSTLTGKLLIINIVRLILRIWICPYVIETVQLAVRVSLATHCGTPDPALSMI